MMSTHFPRGTSTPSTGRKPTLNLWAIHDDFFGEKKSSATQALKTAGQSMCLVVNAMLTRIMTGVVIVALNM